MSRPDFSNYAIFLMIIAFYYLLSGVAAAKHAIIPSGVRSGAEKNIVENNHLFSLSGNEHVEKRDAARTFQTLERKLRKRIVGGTNVTMTNDFPSWVDVDGCGGTLIDKYFVLTAAHCVNTPEKQARREFIYLGAFTDTTGTKVKVEEFILHPGDDDIALLRIGCASRRRVQRLNFNSSIPIDYINEPKTGSLVPQPLTVIGLGRTSTYGPRSSTLLQVAVNNVPIETCNASFANYDPIGPNVINQDTMICAGDLETGGKDSCKGDSGGPLYILLPRTAIQKTEIPSVVPVQVGIVSFGHEECGLREYPGVYTRVSAYETFIKSTIANYYLKDTTVMYCFRNKNTPN
jgi:trypsin